MKLLKLFCLTAILLSPAISVASEWIIRPGAYDSIEHWDDQYFKVTQNGKIGLWNESGQCVVPIEADSITPFYHDIAVVFKKWNDSYQILGSLVRDKGYHKFSKPYSVFMNYGFYSEGLMPVIDENNDLGYIDAEGSQILGFDGMYYRLRPFTEGYAVVMSVQQDYYLVNQLGQAQNISFNKSINILGITNVLDGKAYIMQSKLKWWSYDIYTQSTQKEQMPSTSYDYLFCPTCLSGRPTEVPFDKPVAGGYYQFVETNSGLGLIRDTDDKNPISIVQSESLLKYYPEQTPYAKFKIDLPEKYASIDLAIQVTDKNGSVPVSYSMENGEYVIKCDQGADSKSFIVEIEDDGLLLSKNELAYQFEKLVHEALPLKVTLHTSGTQANENDLVAVVATLTNPGDTEVTTSVSLSGSPAFIEKVQKVTVPANGTARVTSYFKVTKKLSNATVIASTDRGETASLKLRELNPFY